MAFVINCITVDNTHNFYSQFTDGIIAGLERVAHRASPSYPE
jgi:hypothetical protein